MEKSDITLKADDVPTMLSLPSPTLRYPSMNTARTIARNEAAARLGSKRKESKILPVTAKSNTFVVQWQDISCR